MNVGIEDGTSCEPMTPVAETQPHDCRNNSKVIECNDVTDKCECRVCGKTWTEACSFDDDYS